MPPSIGSPFDAGPPQRGFAYARLTDEHQCARTPLSFVQELGDTTKFRPSPDDSWLGGAIHVE